MWPDRVSNPGPLTYESGALPTTVRGPAALVGKFHLSELKMVCILLHGQTIAFWPRGYKKFLMLNSAEHGIFPHKC